MACKETNGERERERDEETQLSPTTQKKARAQEGKQLQIEREKGCARERQLRESRNVTRCLEMRLIFCKFVYKTGEILKCSR